MRPRGAGVDREARRTIAGDGRAAGILQCLPRTSEIGAESRGIHRENALVIPAVARDFVARIDDPADQRGVTMRDPAEREEGRLDPRLAEQLEHSTGIAFDALRQPIPLRFSDHRFTICSASRWERVWLVVWILLGAG